MTNPSTTELNCLFCRIIRKEIPSTILQESERSVIIADIAPQAPFHALIIPRRHATDLGAFMKGGGASAELEDLFSEGLALVREREIDQKGYRIVINTGEEGGQTVAHLHLHLLAGRPLGWPPG